MIIVTEKLDGCNASVAKIGGEIIALTRKGYRASTSPYDHLIWFDLWVQENRLRFDAVLQEGEWLSGEWCIMAHGTRYAFSREPYFVFDLFRDGKRITYDELSDRLWDASPRFEQPLAFYINPGVGYPVEKLLDYLERVPPGLHGAIDPVEGAVWRVEREGCVDFLVKYVRPGKVDGMFLPVGDAAPTWNWWGADTPCINHLKSSSLRVEAMRAYNDSVRSAGIGY